MRISGKITGALAAAGILFAVSGCGMLGGSAPESAISTYDFGQMKLVQLEEPAEGQPIAVIETSLGTVTAVLYPEYAPNTVDNFINRANEGFYDGKDVYALIEQTLFMTGACNAEGTQGFTNDGQLIPNEYSVDLWPFKGAFCSYNAKSGYSDSRFFVVNGKALDDSEVEQLRAFRSKDDTPLPEELITAFVEKGSFVNISGCYTVFGQAIDGIDVIEKICAAERDEKTARPLQPITLHSVRIKEYHKE